MSPKGYTAVEDVETALNRACDDIIAAADLPDTGARDALNLLVNAAIAYVHDPNASTLGDVAEAAYGLPLDEIIGWIYEAG